MNSIEILVPELPESVSDATVINWKKKVGEKIKQDEVLVELETDKIVLEIPSSISGIVQSIHKKKGSIVFSKQLLCKISTFNKDKKTIKNIDKKNTKKIKNYVLHKNNQDDFPSPSIRRLILKHNLKSIDIQNTKSYKKLTAKNINHYVDLTKEKNKKTLEIQSKKENNRVSKRIPMSRLRQRISERLLEAKKNMAMLTTFNEVNMNPILKLRKKYGENFKNKHKVQLGFMSFFVKAVVEALKAFPNINSSIDATDIISYSYFDISIAISTSRGLITPVLRNADTLSIAKIEKCIKNFVIKVKENTLSVKELTGGNFTITNGGVFGSLLSTPIINPPQSAILGMHTIKDRAVVVDKKIKILPMMYLALSYDHCLIDGNDAVSFLMKIKEILENPIQIFLNI